MARYDSPPSKSWKAHYDSLTFVRVSISHIPKCRCSAPFTSKSDFPVTPPSPHLVHLLYNLQKKSEFFFGPLFLKAYNMGAYIPEMMRPCMSEGGIWLPRMRRGGGEGEESGLIQRECILIFFGGWECAGIHVSSFKFSISLN